MGVCEGGEGEGGPQLNSPASRPPHQNPDTCTQATPLPQTCMKLLDNPNA